MRLTLFRMEFKRLWGILFQESPDEVLRRDSAHWRQQLGTEDEDLDVIGSCEIYEALDHP